MSQISLKSITGITSITTPAGVDNQLTLHTNDTTQRVKVTQSGIEVTGVTTSTTFSGSGASLTNLPAANLTGTLPAISGANLTSLPSQLTLSNNADNRVITGGSGTNLNGESNLTYDGTTLTNGVGGLALQSAGGDLINVTSTTASSRSTIKFNTNGNDWEIGARGSSGNPNNSFYFYDNATTSYRLVINSAGAVMVGGTLQAGTNGGLNAEVTDSGNQRVPLALINQGTADGSGVIISHRGKDDAGNQEDYNYIRMVADDTGSGSEDGSIRFWTIGGGSLAQRARIDSSGFNITPVTLAARNAGVSTATGTIIYNSTSSTLQVYQGTKWDTLSNVSFTPTGGNATYTFGSYKVHAFTSNGNFVPNTAGTVDILIVAGGGGAGTPDRTNYNGAWNGGGGAGGVLYTTSVSVTAQSYSIVIGAGGARQANGDNSTALGLTAIGGGRGGGTTSAGSGNVNWNGAAGGSGGGGLGDRPGPMQGGAGTAGQGNAGANGTDPGGSPNFEQGGGGGGAGEAGDTDGIGYGGDGRDMSAQFGTTYGENGVFGGGGAGGQGTDNSSSVNYGGTGGGGNSGGGYQNNSYASEAGAANTGGGGGAGGNATGGAGGQPGGSGIVLIRYLT